MQTPISGSINEDRGSTPTHIFNEITRVLLLAFERMTVRIGMASKDPGDQLADFHQIKQYRANVP